MLPPAAYPSSDARTSPTVGQTSWIGPAPSDDDDDDGDETRSAGPAGPAGPVRSAPSFSLAERAGSSVAASRSVRREPARRDSPNSLTSHFSEKEPIDENWPTMGASRNVGENAIFARARRSAG